MSPAYILLWPLLAGVVMGLSARSDGEPRLYATAIGVLVAVAVLLVELLAIGGM